MNREDVVALMESSRTSAEWNDNCDAVKAAHEGRYPDFWYEAILASGLARRVLATFGADPDFRVTADGVTTTIRNDGAA